MPWAKEQVLQMNLLSVLCVFRRNKRPSVASGYFIEQTIKIEIWGISVHCRAIYKYSRTSSCACHDNSLLWRTMLLHEADNMALPLGRKAAVRMQEKPDAETLPLRNEI